MNNASGFGALWLPKREHECLALDWAARRPSGRSPGSRRHCALGGGAPARPPASLGSMADRLSFPLEVPPCLVRPRPSPTARDSSAATSPAVRAGGRRARGRIRRYSATNQASTMPGRLHIRRRTSGPRHGSAPRGGSVGPVWCSPVTCSTARPAVRP